MLDEMFDCDQTPTLLVKDFLNSCNFSTYANASNISPTMKTFNNGCICTGFSDSFLKFDILSMQQILFFDCCIFGEMLDAFAYVEHKKL